MPCAQQPCYALVLMADDALASITQETKGYNGPMIGKGPRELITMVSTRMSTTIGISWSIAAYCSLNKDYL